MKIKSKNILKVSLLLFLFSNSMLWSQSNIKKGFKFGIEVKNSMLENTGTLSNSLGYTFGLYTGIKLYSFTQSAIVLRTEINFVKLQYYDPNRRIYNVVNTNANNWNGLDYAVFDEKYWFNIIELGIIPEYHLRLNEKLSLEIFIGPSIGLGNKGLETRQLDNNPLRSDPYDEYAMDFITTSSLNMGLSFYYFPLVFDIRYRYSNINKYSSIKTEFNNVYVQIGLGL